MEVERCVGEVAKRLQEDERRGVEWVGGFVEACGWFERQVVCVLSYQDLRSCARDG